MTLEQALKNAEDNSMTPEWAVAQFSGDLTIENKGGTGTDVNVRGNRVCWLNVLGELSFLRYLASKHGFTITRR